VRPSRSCILCALSASFLLLGLARTTPAAEPAPTPGEPAPAAAPPPSATATLAAPATPADAGAAQDQPRPPPLHVDYASYGLAFAADFLAAPGAVCRDQPPDGIVPCILGSGGGLILRGGYRSPGPWYIGGAYQFSKTGAGNLYRLPILQELRAEMRYMLDMGFRISPYATWGLGGMIYGNEWGAETGGGSLFAGLGAELQLSRVAVLGLALVYEPMLIAGWTDTAAFERPTGMAHYFRLELDLEVRSELHRR
jgi:hypothetical protein